MELCDAHAPVPVSQQEILLKALKTAVSAVVALGGLFSSTCLFCLASNARSQYFLVELQSMEARLLHSWSWEPASVPCAVCSMSNVAYTVMSGCPGPPITVWFLLELVSL